MTQRSIIILCGGQSAEHEISILSACHIIQSLDLKKYVIQVVYLTQSGQWFWVDPNDSKAFSEQRDKPLILIPGNGKKSLALASNPEQFLAVDCVIPMLHGSRGEDGAIQGLLEMLGLPYVGCDILGSALCMQKHITKRLLRFAGLPTVDWLTVDSRRSSGCVYEEVAKALGPVLFIKPSALGSSVGISKVRNKAEFDAGLKRAFQYDHQVVVEPFFVGREIECSVLGGDDPIASLPGELISQHDYYSYDAKYNDPGSLELITPADLPAATVKNIQEIAVDTFKALQCHGMARIDFFVGQNQEVMVNEVNTMPGFTELSLYPKNWQASGLAFPELLDTLIDLALARYQQDASISHQYIDAGTTRENSV
jgi:D-alanine-D-alanine ligase